MPSRTHWNLHEPSPRLPACATCGGRGWCLDCEGTRLLASFPQPVECACGSGLCPMCDGRGTCAPPITMTACPRCGGEELASVAHRCEDVAGDPLTSYQRTELRCSCGHAETIDARESVDAWRSPHMPPRGPGEFRCPTCASERVRVHVPDDDDDCAAALRCWACGHDERALSHLGLAAWRNPAYAADGMARVVAIERAREDRATTDKARFTDRWPWRPRVRTSPAVRRSHPLPAWVEEVMHAPDDPYVRLVGADLVEREDPARAAFMRDQIVAEARLASARTTIEIETTLREITCRRVASYSPELGALAAERMIAVRGFARGMVEHVTMTAADFLAHGDEVLERAPIRFLTLTYAESVVDQLAASPWLARLHALRLPRAEPVPSLDLLRRSQGLDSIEVNAIDDAALSVLCESPHLGALEYLDLDGHAGISVVTWGRLALAAPKLRWVGGAPRRGELRSMEVGYELSRWVVPDPTAIAIDTAAGSQVAWLPLDEPYMTTWDRIRAVCAHAPVMQRRA